MGWGTIWAVGETSAWDWTARGTRCAHDCGCNTRCGDAWASACQVGWDVGWTRGTGCSPFRTCNAPCGGIWTGSSEVDREVGRVQVGRGARPIGAANWITVPLGQGVRLIGGAKWAQTQFGKGLQEIWAAKSADGHWLGARERIWPGVPPSPGPFSPYPSFLDLPLFVRTLGKPGRGPCHHKKIWSFRRLPYP